MKPGSHKKLFFLIFLLYFNISFVFAEDKIESVPLVNLEELSPTFEEEKDELEKIDNTKNNSEDSADITKKTSTKKDDKIYINLTALDKITAKTSSIRLAVGEKKFFGDLEIKVLKCQLSQNSDSSDTAAYLQVKDLSTKDNDQVFLFNGWTFSSSPSIRPFDHPVYDIWLSKCF